jgi:phage portal protein BeeE
VNVISQDLAKVPLMMFRRKDDGGRERVTDHPVVKLLRQPARNMTAVDWKQRLQAHQLMRGNGYCEIITGYRGGVIRSCAR